MVGSDEISQICHEARSLRSRASLVRSLTEQRISRLRGLLSERQALLRSAGSPAAREAADRTMQLRGQTSGGAGADPETPRHDSRTHATGPGT